MTTYRYRQVPTFGRGTIRQFHKNASAMKRLAAHDFKDLLQVRLIPSKFDNELMYFHFSSALFLYSKDFSPLIRTRLFSTSFSILQPGTLMQSFVYILMTLLHFSTPQQSSSASWFANFSTLLAHIITPLNFLVSTLPMDAVSLN
jgi:hypothetical protein